MEAKKRNFYLTVIAVTLMFSSGNNAAAAIRPDLDYFKDKVINFIVGTQPGGGYDTYARLIGKYLQKNIPGAKVIVKNMPGAGHIIGANETYLAKPNGLTIGSFSTGLIYSQIVGKKGIRFDLAKYSWIGKANSEYRVLVVGQKTPFGNLRNLIESKEPIKMACSGVGGTDYNETLMLANALGINFKLVPGYNGREGEMAIMRGEIAGIIGSYTGLISFIKAKECRVVLQIGTKKHKDLPDVPLATELKVSPKERSLISLIVATNELGRITAGPPNIPLERLAVLRDAYKKTLTQPEFLKEAENIGLEINPAFGEEVAQMMRGAIRQPEENILLLNNIINAE